METDLTQLEGQVTKNIILWDKTEPEYGLDHTADENTTINFERQTS